MGCFSFKCKISGKAANSDSFQGDAVKLYLLEKGKVIEEMYGQYDSYGRVFDENGDSFEWALEWGEVCDLMFDSDEGSGIALVLDEYDDGRVPKTKSEDDPDQGWNDITNMKLSERPYHKVYKGRG